MKTEHVKWIGRQSRQILGWTTHICEKVYERSTPSLGQEAKPSVICSVISWLTPPLRQYRTLRLQQYFWDKPNCLSLSKKFLPAYFRLSSCTGILSFTGAPSFLLKLNYRIFKFWTPCTLLHRENNSRTKRPCGYETRFLMSSGGMGQCEGHTVSLLLLH